MKAVPTEIDGLWVGEYELEDLRENPALLWRINNPTDEQLLVAIEGLNTSQLAGIFDYIKKPTEEVQLAVIKKRPEEICSIDNPSEEIQLKAVRGGPLVLNIIFFLSNSKNGISENVQLESLRYADRSSVHIFPYLPSCRKLSFQLKAIEINPHIIDCIVCPKIVVQEKAIALDSKLLIQYPSQFCRLTRKKYDHLILAGNMGILEN